MGGENLKDKELREAGLKVTVPRLKILKILEESRQHHLSAEEVYKILLDQGEDVGLATVYRVLTQFENAGLIKKHNFEGGHSVYELHQGDHHDHIVCIHCGLVKEFVDDIIEERQEKIAEKYHFEVTDHNHTIYGLCEQCREKKREKKR